MSDERRFPTERTGLSARQDELFDAAEKRVPEYLGRAREVVEGSSADTDEIAAIAAASIIAKSEGDMYASGLLLADLQDRLGVEDGQ